MNEHMIPTEAVGGEPERLFGELRSLLEQAPGAQTWGDVCALLERAWLDHPSLTHQVLVPYTLAKLTRWPESLRRMPSNWLSYLGNGREFAPARIAKIVRLRPTTGERAREILGWLEEASISSLDVSRADLNRLQLLALELFGLKRGFRLLR